MWGGTMAKYTPEQKKEYAQQKREEQRQMLEQAITKLCSSEGWQQYLDARSRFHKYSFSNVILIALQRPEATLVAGAGKWRKEFDRLIREGEKAIKILAPQIIYAKDESGKIVMKDGKKVIDRVWYKTVPVFDVSQTEGEPIPGPTLEPITGHTHEEYLLRCEQYAKGLGYNVEYCNMPEGMESERTADTSLITINYDLELNGRVRALARELAHLAVWNDPDHAEYTRAQLEVIMESVAYLTTANIGLDTAGMSVPYIATWGQEDDSKGALETLKDFATKIDSVTETLVEAIS